MVNEHITGYIVDLDETGTLHITASAPSLERALKREYEECEIILQDGRKISPEQRRKVYALLGEIAEYVNGIRNSDTVEETKALMKWEFMLKRMESQERRLFSLSNCSMTVAKEFISYLIDFIIAEDIPTSVSLIDNCEDITRYVYQCAANRKCAVCGKPADVHHMEGSRVQAGNDREEVHHLGRSILPLCRVHHEECHNSEMDFLHKYHLESITLDEFLCKKLKLKK